MIDGCRFSGGKAVYEEAYIRKQGRIEIRIFLFGTLSLAILQLSDFLLSPRLDNTLVRLIVNLDIDTFTREKGIWLHKLPLHLRFRHNNLAPFLIHALNCAQGLVELAACGYIGGAAPDV